VLVVGIALQHPDQQELRSSLVKERLAVRQVGPSLGPASNNKALKRENLRTVCLPPEAFGFVLWLGVYPLAPSGRPDKYDQRLVVVRVPSSEVVNKQRIVSPFQTPLSYGDRKM